MFVELASLHMILAVSTVDISEQLNPSFYLEMYILEMGLFQNLEVFLEVKLSNQSLS